VKYTARPPWYSSSGAVAGVAAGLAGASQYLVLSLRPTKSGTTQFSCLKSAQLQHNYPFALTSYNICLLPRCFSTLIFCFIALAHTPEKTG